MEFLCFHYLLSYVAPCCFIFYDHLRHVHISDGPKWQFLKMRCEVEEEYSRRVGNSDKVSDKELKLFESFRCANAARNTREFCQATGHGFYVGI